MVACVRIASLTADRSETMLQFVGILRSLEQS